MAANTIEPAIGASTWALGSHRWVPYIGSFAKNAIIEATHHKIRVLIGVPERGSVSNVRGMFVESKLL